MCLPGYIKIPIRIRDAPALTTSGRSVPAVLDVKRRSALDRLVYMTRGTRGAYRREDRVALPPELQKELIEKAASRYGNCQELAKHLDIPKSSVHYYRIGRLTIPQSLLEKMLGIADDDGLRERVACRGVAKDRTWANEHAISVYREMCRDKVRLPTKEELENDDELRRKAAAIVSYVMAEGSVWLMKDEWGEHAANITFASHETDLFEHFRGLCVDVFSYDLGTPQMPGNGSKAIRGFIYSRFVAEWLANNGVPVGDKASTAYHIPKWVLQSNDPLTWRASLQPWFDGEGHVCQRNGRICIGQSRHSDLDFHVLQHGLGWRGRSREVNLAGLREHTIYGISAYDYLSALGRSEVFDDVLMMIRRLGISAQSSLTGAYLKDDGSWSANWIICIPRREARKVLELGLVRQQMKRSRLTAAVNKE